MATAEEKTALGLSPDASEADVSAKIAELTSASEQTSKDAQAEIDNLVAERDAASARADEAMKYVGAASKENARLRDLASELRTAPSNRTGESDAVAAHNVAQVSETNAHGLLDVVGGHEITIKIRAFPYYVDVEDPVTMRPMRQECIATRGMTVKVSDIDYRRAQKFDAAYTEEELAERNKANPLNQSELTLADATVADISHWLQTDKPTINEVLDEVNNDPDVARKVIDAENHATGQQPRKGLIDELDAIANS